jgi:alanine dehydrogenase
MHDATYIGILDSIRADFRRAIAALSTPLGGRMPVGSSSVRVLTSACLARHFTVRDVVELVHDGYRAAADGDLVEKARTHLDAPGTKTILHVCPGIWTGGSSVGVYMYTGGNRGQAVPQKVMMLFRVEDGGLEAVIESGWLSWARTGASGAVATRALARPDAQTLGIVGTGRQARAQVAAHVATGTYTEGFCYGRDEARRTSFAADMQTKYGIAMTPLNSAEAVVERSDVVCTATNSRAPVFDGAAVRPGTHINAIGQHYPDRRELDTRTVAGARLYADLVERAVTEDGELLIAQAEDPPPQLTVLGSIGDVLTGRCPGRQSADDVTVFLSGGTSGEYLSVSQGIARRAAELGLGTTVELSTGWPDETPPAGNG